MRERYTNEDADEFRKRTILAICAAGSDRSQYIAEELNDRGYVAMGAGVIQGHNYVTPEDLDSIGVIVFASPHEKKIFEKDKKLAELVKRNRIEVRVLNITESDKDRAHCGGRVSQLREDISKQLDCVGLTGY